MVKKICFFALLPFLAFPQENNSLKNFEYFKSMIGTWENQTNRGFSYEIWELANDSTMLGESFTVSDQDTVSYESISLQLRGGQIYYIPVVRNQNDGQPIFFKLISIKNEAVFENKEHDFPQRIIYKISGDKLNAAIEGTKNGKQRRVDFLFNKKVKD